MLRRLLVGNASKTIASAAAVVGLMSLVSRALGLLRDRVLAGEFGADAVLDTYYAAFRLPDLLFTLLVVGALSAGFIPIFTEAFNGDGARHQAAWRLVNNVLQTVALASGLAALVMLAFVEPMTRLLTPGFPPAALGQTVAMTRIMLLSPLLLGVSAVLGGVLQSLKQFLVFSLAPVFYNVGIIAGALFLVPRYGIRGLAWGVVLGAGLHLLIQLPAVVSLGYRFLWALDWRDAQLRQMVKLMGPRTASLALTQLNWVVVTVFASSLSAGSLTVFTLANNLQSLPLGVFGLAFAVAAFPTLAELANQRERFIATLSQTLRQILFLMLPAAGLLIGLRAQVVRIVLGSGRFDWPDTVQTADTLVMFCLSLFAQAVIPLLIRAYFAQRDSVTPLVTTLGGSLLNITLALVLPAMTLPGQSRPLGVAGLALAFSLSNVLQLAVLLWLLRARLGRLDGRAIAASVGKMLAATVVMLVAVQLVKSAAATLTGTQTFLGVATQAVAASFVGVVAYTGVSLMLRSPEARAAVEIFRRRRPLAAVTETVTEPGN